MPVELEISGLPGLASVRSVSKFGLSQVVATFDDDTEITTARQYVSERLLTVELPDGVGTPQMGPISTGLGEIFHYVIRSSDGKRSLEQLRTIHDWIIKPELRKVPGVAEVNSWGGFEKQYHVVVDPELLVKFNLSLADVVEALEKNNRNVGGGRAHRQRPGSCWFTESGASPPFRRSSASKSPPALALRSVFLTSPMSASAASCAVERLPRMARAKSSSASRSC